MLPTELLSLGLVGTREIFFSLKFNILITYNLLWAPIFFFQKLNSTLKFKYQRQKHLDNSSSLNYPRKKSNPVTIQPIPKYIYI